MKKGCIIGRMFKFLFKALSVTFVVLFTVYMLNLEMIVAEVLKAVIGSMGILFTVPLTTVFSAFIFLQTLIARKIKH